jgi:ribonuclease J
MTSSPSQGGGRESGELLFLPLGGSGEIGMNLNLYGYAGKWLMVDLGVTFGDEGVPGADVITPDPTFIEEHRKDLVALVLTHAHEDHLGAVPYLWPRLRCPVYATAFTASVLRRKLQETNLLSQVPITEIPLSGRFKVEPFDVELIRLTHSIPEPNALAIRTGAGTVLHTGDWKLDPEPLVGDVTDEASLRALSEEGVLALVGDSTNALRHGESGSEAEVRKALTGLFGNYKGRIAVACFASNIARLESIAVAAAAHDRHVALVGRSLWRMNEAARENGYLKGIPDFLDEEQAGFIPREKLVLICTGSQGEPRAALARIARDEHPHVVLEKGDVVIFSSRVIPGNERAVHNIWNGLLHLGIEVVTDETHPQVHVSGHPARDELTQMYQWVRPKIAVPVHGEPQHLRAHAELARMCQVPHAIVPENGTLIRLAPGMPEIIDHVTAGRLAVDGERLLPVDGAVMRGRTRLLWNGALVATVVVDRKGRLATDPQISAPGLIDPESDAEMLADINDAIRDAVADLGRKPDEHLREELRRRVRRLVRDRTDKKPNVDIHLVRL